MDEHPRLPDVPPAPESIERVPASSTARALRRWLLWPVSVLVALLLSLSLVVWSWMASPASLGQTLSWVQAYLEQRPVAAGRLHVQEAWGTLRTGGRIAHVRWEQDGLEIEASGVKLQWPKELWWQLLTEHRLDLTMLHADELRVRDEREATNGQPLHSAQLPLTLTIPWSVNQLTVHADPQILLRDMRGIYSYGTAHAPSGEQTAHWLRVDHLVWAGGEYRAEGSLGAQSPMPLRVQASARLKMAVPQGVTQDLAGELQMHGQLAGESAVLEARLRLQQATAVQGQPPVLEATAHLRPNDAAMPLHALDARVHQLNLAELWPDAPQTLLSGRVQVAKEDARWQADMALDNQRPAPIDQRGLPLKRLTGQLRQSTEGWELDGLQAWIGNGRLQGRASLAALASTWWLQPWTAELQLERIDTSDIWGQLSGTAVSGAIQADATDAPAGYAGAALNIDLKGMGTQNRTRAGLPNLFEELRLSGRWQAPAQAPTKGRIHVDSLALKALMLTLDGRGEVDLASDRLQGRFSAGAPGWSARWSGIAAADEGKGTAGLAIEDAGKALSWLRQWQQIPWIGQRLTDQLALPATLQAQGRATATLAWQDGMADLALDIRVPDLRLQASDGVDWRLRETRLQVGGQPERLAMQLDGALRAATGELQISTRGRAFARTGWPKAGQLTLDALTLVARAAPPAGKAWHIDTPQSIAVDWQARDEGLTLSSSAGALVLTPRIDRVSETGNAAMTLRWEQLQWQQGAILTRGRIQGLPVAWLDLLPAGQGDGSGSVLGAAGIESDMLLRGEWNLQLPASANAHPRVDLLLEREQGDLRIQPERMGSRGRTMPGPLAVGVETARLALTSDAGNVQVSARWASERMGTAELQLRTALSPPASGQPAWHWAEDAPLAGSLRARLPQLGIWSMLAPPGWRVQGSLDVQAEIAGNRQSPQWSGQLTAADLLVRSVVEGIAFDQGRVRASFDGDRLRVDELYLQGPGGREAGGHLSATGSAQWPNVVQDGHTRREPLIALSAQAHRLRISNRPDRRLTLSGQVDATLRGASLDIRGRLDADSASFILPDEVTPRLGDDVIVRRHGLALPESSRALVQTTVEVGIGLGPSFEVRGQGLVARLGGNLTVRSTPALPGLRVQGEVRTRSGSYRAYGQQLDIETGVLRFNGPYDDPALDVVAVRPNLRQRVGVQIQGTAQRPLVSLFSDPDLPDSEKLAWLVLGRPATGAGTETAVLQQAALALLAGRGEGVGSQLANFLGLDKLTMVNRGEDGEALNLGKHLSNRLYLNYERGLLSTLGTVAVFYDISRWLTLRARAGEENAVDLIFLREFD